MMDTPEKALPFISTPRLVLRLGTPIDAPSIADFADVIAMINLTNIVRGPAQFCYLGYSVDYRHEGQGLMREGLAASISFGFTELNLHRIMANYRPDNVRSARLLERLGFVVEGYARKYLYLNGSWCDHVLTSVTNETWLAPQSD